MIAVTAIFGGYDTLKPHPEHPKVDEWRCYTDDALMMDNPRGWNVIHAPMPYAHPRLSAKWWKCHPEPYIDTLWIDGSVEVLHHEFIDEVIHCLDEAQMAMWVHPWRDCIYDEANVSVPMAKYDGLPLAEQVDRYRALGWSEHAGLWASTVIGWRGDLNCLRMGAAWFAHNETLTYQDQLSLPVLLARYGITPAPLPGAFLDPRWVRWHGHASDL